MKSQQTEADARIQIDELLRAVGWDPADKSQVRTEVYAKALGAVGEDEGPTGVMTTAEGDQVPTGRADYVLLDQNGRPLAVIEAKKNAINPYIAKQQCK